MKLLYDHQIFSQQQYGGISRYFFELIKRFDGIDNSCEVATMFSDNAYYNKDFNSKLKSFFPTNNFKGKGRIIGIINQEVSSRKIKKNDFDLFHPTYYDDYFFKNIRSKPFVVTFHDMIHEKFSDQYNELKLDTKIYNRKKLLLENSNKIIAISKTTKNDIIDVFGVDPSKIDVIYHGNSLDSFDIGSEPLITEDYILFVGNRRLYKNFDFFVTNIAKLLIDANLKLICAGGGVFSTQELNLIISLKLENHVVFKEIVNDNVLANYYTYALFFCFPSLYEGFGIPILESFACGCPILLSNGGSLPEIAGEAAFYFDPTNEESLKQSASELINNQYLRQEMREKGFKRLKLFSWETTFLETLDVYKSVKY